MSIVSGTIAAVNQRESEKEANRTNARNVRDTNEANLFLDMARRGLALPEKIGGVTVPADAVGKSSAILPYYLNDSEMSAANYAGDIFDVLSDELNADSIGEFRTASERYRDAFNQARGDTLGIFNGGITDEELAAAQPVAAARIKLANARKDAGLEALQEKLNEIKAIQNRKGYTGDSLASQRLRFDATRKVLGDAAMDRSNAELANAMDTSNIRRNAIARRLQSQNAPLDQIRREIQFSDIPSEGIRTRAESNISVLNPFRVNGGFQTIQRPDRVGPLPSTLGIVAANAAQMGNQAANYFAGSGGGGWGMVNSFSSDVNKNYTNKPSSYSGSYGYGGTGYEMDYVGDY